MSEGRTAGYRRCTSAWTATRQGGSAASTFPQRRRRMKETSQTPGTDGDEDLTVGRHETATLLRVDSSSTTKTVRIS